MANQTKSVDAVAYTRGDAALASGVPPVTLDLAIKAGDLPAIKSGRRFIILRDDLVAWLRLCQERGNLPARVTDEDRERLAELNRTRRRKAVAA